ncbi:hypothetical protein ANTRET_LOCUS3622 [Anthophora retusa]
MEINTSTLLPLQRIERNPLEREKTFADAQETRLIAAATFVQAAAGSGTVGEEKKRRDDEGGGRTNQLSGPRLKNTKGFGHLSRRCCPRGTTGMKRGGI